MSRRLIYRKEVADDLKQAADWFGERSSRLRDAFLEQVQKALDRVAASPTLWAPNEKGIRTAPIKKFSYRIVYLSTENATVVLGVLHTSRDESVWRSRLDSGEP